jgi:hypothetical protein
MTIAAAVEPLPIVRTIRAAADVIEIEDGLGFAASVLVVPGAPAVARLARSLVGAAREGRVLRQVMLTTAGIRGPGLFVWWRGDPSTDRLVARIALALAAMNRLVL